MGPKMNLDPKNPNQRLKMSFKAIQEAFIQENRQNSLRTVRTDAVLTHSHVLVRTVRRLFWRCRSYTLPRPSTSIRAFIDNGFFFPQ
jgi:hypothetical protein